MLITFRPAALMRLLATVAGVVLVLVLVTVNTTPASNTPPPSQPAPTVKAEAGK